MAELHKHLLVKGYLKEPLQKEFLPELEDWFVRLVDKVGMNILIPPKAVWCDTPGNEGLTCTVCIDTSHSSIHSWPDFFTFDLYSCKDFEVDDVFDMLYELGTVKVEYDVIDRNSHRRFHYFEKE